MKVIRDNELPELMIIPLLQQMGISRCNVEGCSHRPSTIIEDDEQGFTAGICEDHYQEAKSAGQWKYTLTFDPPQPLPFCNK